MITHGVRIEFYGPRALGTKQRPLLGALQCLGGYTALAVPAKGSKISISSLRTAPSADWTPLLVGTHVVVHDILHTPVPTRDGQVPSWWGAADEPTITVVVRAELHGSVAALIPPLTQFADGGWQLVDATAGSDLDRAWMLMSRERQLRATAAAKQAA